MSTRTLTRASDGLRITADTLLGAGTQGEVWRAAVDGNAVAIKIYHRGNATRAQRELIERLITKGSPARSFLWPTTLVEDKGNGTFGYIMELREARFRSVDDFMARRVDAGFRALLSACLQLVNAFLDLHAKGLCYRDISFGNVFVDPHTGDVRICDNDNVDIPGGVSGVLGTPRFMAPEIVRRESSPSDQTDRYSLAVLMFYLLFGGHPLDGAREAQIKCLDIPALEKLYGREPLYIWDANDNSNRPVPEIHKNPIAFRTMYPQRLLEMFDRSFTEGLRFPTKRVRESEWRNVLMRVLDGLQHCECGAENFYDPQLTGHAGVRACWHCKRVLAPPIRIRIGDREVALEDGISIRRYHLSHVHDATGVALVVKHPSTHGLLGLKNISDEAWSATRPDGTVFDVGPGRAAPVIDGNKVNFGVTVGEIVF